MASLQDINWLMLNYVGATTLDVATEVQLITPHLKSVESQEDKGK